MASRWKPRSYHFVSASCPLSITSARASIQAHPRAPTPSTIFAPSANQQGASSGLGDLRRAHSTPPTSGMLLGSCAAPPSSSALRTASPGSAPAGGSKLTDIFEGLILGSQSLQGILNNRRLPECHLRVRERCGLLQHSLH